jgi:adenine deaminase
LLPDYEEHQRLIETSRGDRPADLFVRGGTIANVYSGELHEGNSCPEAFQGRLIASC